MQHVRLPPREEVRQWGRRFPEAGLALERGVYVVLRDVELSDAEPQVRVLEGDQRAEPGAPERGDRVELPLQCLDHLKLPCEMNRNLRPDAGIRLVDTVIRESAGAEPTRRGAETRRP